MSANQLTPPVDTEPTPTTPRTLLFYRQDGVVVTSRHFTIGGQHYELEHLTDLRLSKKRRHPGVTGGIVFALVDVAVLLPLAVVMEAPLVLALAAATCVLSVLVAVACATAGRPRRELVGRYQGGPVTLFSTRDQLEFGKVTRALMRAMETARSIR
jgi:hypothetical protein